MNHETASRRDATNQAVVPAERVRVSGEAARVMPPRRADKCEPQVEIVRDGATIQAIDIRCTCGRRVYLRCEN